MNLPTPDYAVPPAEPTQAIEVTRFTDGGVTVVVRKIKPKLSRAGTIIALSIPALLFAGLLCQVGIPWPTVIHAVRMIPSLPAAVLQFLIDQPVSAAFICSPL